MSTRNVVLTDHQNQLIDNLVASGRYQNASEAMRAGLRLLEQEEAGLQALIDRIDGAVLAADRDGVLNEPGAETIRKAFEKAQKKNATVKPDAA